MKKQYILLAACLAVAACAKEGIEPDYVPEYYTFKAVFDEETKMDFGDPAAGKIALQWKTGDEVGFTLEKSDDSKVTRKGTIAVDGETVTVTMDLNLAKNGWESIQDIWYPYNGGTKLATIPTSQSYDCVAVPVQKTAITASTVTFATYLPYVVLEFPVTQTSHLISGETHRSNYLPKSTRLSQITLSTSGESYLLNTSEDPSINLKTLKDVVDASSRVTVNKSYYLVIPPITDETITVTYTTEDNIGFSNRKNSLTLANKTYRKMPVMDLTGYHFWRFGTAHTNTDCNGVVYWLRDPLGNGTQMTLGSYNDVTYIETNGDHYMTVYPYNNAGTYIYDVGPMWNTGRFSSDGSAILGLSAFLTFSKNYPIFAIAMDAPKSLANVTTGSGYHKFEPSDVNSRAFINETGKPCTLIYAKLDDNIVKNVDIYDQNRIKMYLRLGFSSEPDPAPGIKIYWAGTFRSIDEATSYYNSYFGY